MPFDFSAYLVAPGEKPISSSKFNNFLQAVQAGMNAMPPANLTGFPSDAAKYLNGAGGWTTPVTDMAAVYTKTTPTDVVSSSALTDLFGGAITIAAGKMAANAAIKIFASGDYLNNSGNPRTIDLALTLGAQTLWQSAPSGQYATSATRRGWWFMGFVQGITTASQIGGGYFCSSDSNPPTVGVGVIGPIDGNGKFAAPFSTVQGTVNMTGSQALALKVAHSAALATLSMRCLFARVEVTA